MYIVQLKYISKCNKSQMPSTVPNWTAVKTVLKLYEKAVQSIYHDSYNNNQIVGDSRQFNQDLYKVTFKLIKLY